MTTLAYFEGEFVPMAQANVSIACNTLHYGTGCFGGIRAYWNETQEQLYLFRVRDHYKRLLNSAKLLFCELDYTAEQLAEITTELLSREGWRENVYIRPLVYKDDGIFRVWLHDSTDKIAIFSHPVGSYIKAEGIKVGVSSWRRVDDTAMPARGKVNGAYVNSALAKSDAMLSGFDEALVLNQDGHVSEASAANVMIVRDGVVLTPPVTANVLEGITRRTVMQLLRDDLKLLLMSATLDTDRLGQLLNAPLLQCPGRGYPVTTHYRPRQHAQESLGDHGRRVIQEALNDHETGHILVFLPGTRDIQRLQQALRSLPGHIHVLPLQQVFVPTAVPDARIRTLWRASLRGHS